MCNGEDLASDALDVALDLNIVGGESHRVALRQLVADADLVLVAHAGEPRGRARDLAPGVRDSVEDGPRVGVGVRLMALVVDEHSDCRARDHDKWQPAFHSSWRMRSRYLL